MVNRKDGKAFLICHFSSAIYSAPTDVRDRGDKSEEIKIDEKISDDRYSSSNSSFSGFCLCLALRPAGRAFGSGLASIRGCPGGASGRRIELIVDFPVCFLRFRRLRGHSLRLRDSARSWAKSPRRNDPDSGG